MLNKFKQDLNKLKNPARAKILQRFFKTGQGEYGEGDIFLGLKMAQNRQVAKKYTYLKLPDIQKLLNSKIHEYRMVALLVLVNKYEKLKKQSQKSKQRDSSHLAPLGTQNDIFLFYLKNAKRINNWDLVDLSAPNIVGDYLLQHNFSGVPRNVPRSSAIKPIKNEKNKKQSTKILYNLAHSKNLWERRIAILSTYAFIRNNQFKDTIKISEILLKDKHDLIHKAVGWMLREIGKRDEKTLETFLNKHANHMPRTMLRYSIEKFPDKKRGGYLNKK